MAVWVVQQATANVDPGSSVAVTLTGVEPGNEIHIAVGASTSSAAMDTTGTTDLSSDQGDTIEHGVHSKRSGSTGEAKTARIKSAVGGNTQITFTPLVTCTCIIVITEVYGSLETQTGGLDPTNSRNGFGNAPTSNDITPSANGRSFGVGWYINLSIGFTPDAGWGDIVSVTAGSRTLYVGSQSQDNGVTDDWGGSLSSNSNYVFLIGHLEADPYDLIDLFTGSSGDPALEDHTPSEGGNWNRHTSTANDALCVKDATNDVRFDTSTSGARYYVDQDPAGADYSVHAIAQFSNTASTIFAGPVGRLSTSADTYYSVRYRSSSGTARWELFKRVAGTGVVLDSWDNVPATETDIEIELRMASSSISGFINGVERLSATDSNITAKGKFGLSSSQTASNKMRFTEIRLNESGSTTHDVSADDVLSFVTTSSAITDHGPIGSDVLALSDASEQTRDFQALCVPDVLAFSTTATGSKGAQTHDVDALDTVDFVSASTASTIRDALAADLMTFGDSAAAESGTSVVASDVISFSDVSSENVDFAVLGEDTVSLSDSSVIVTDFAVTAASVMDMVDSSVLVSQRDLSASDVMSMLDAATGAIFVPETTAYVIRLKVLCPSASRLKVSAPSTLRIKSES